MDLNKYGKQKKQHGANKYTDQLPRENPTDELQDREVGTRIYEKFSDERHYDIIQRYRNQDIRVLFRRATVRQARTHAPTLRVIDLKNTAIAQLLDENNTKPIKATKRLKRMNTVRAQKSRRDRKHR